jgi:DNA-binding CsgD family transcriptional regulator
MLTLDEPGQAAEVEWPGTTTAAPEALPAATGRPVERERGLVGRGAELAAIRRAVSQARDGEGRTLTLLGEAGIGKSALLGALQEQAQEAGMLVLEGRAAEHERDVPFGAIVDALDDHVAMLHPRRIEALGPELASILPSIRMASRAASSAPTELASQSASADWPAPADWPTAAERFRYHRALRALLEQLGRERPVALLLDDLHWADAASIEFVLHLLRRPPRTAYLAAFAMRPQAPAPQLLDAARNAPGSEQLALAPLSHEASLALIDGVADRDLRERLVRDAGGNPLFLEELARIARRPGAALPPTLIAAVQLEIGSLAPASRMLIDGAAVAGDPFDPELAAAAAGLEPHDALSLLDGLVAADLLRPTTGRAFRFRHPLVRRAVYDAAPPGWRLAAHERAADALAARGAAPTARAYHVEQAARPGDEAAIALLAEAAAAASDTAPATAARWYGAATNLLPHDTPERRAGLLAPMALALANAGRLDHARAALVEVLGLLPPEPTPMRLAIVAACANVEQTLGRHADARRRLLAALQDAPAESEATLAYELAIAAIYTAEDEPMGRWARRAAEAAGDHEPALKAGAEAMAGLAAIRDGRCEEGAALLDCADARLSALDDEALGARLDAGFVVGMSDLLAERPRSARPTFVRALDIARATRQGHMLAPLSIGRSMGLVGLLDLDTAAREIETAEEIARLQGVQYQLYWALWTRAWIHWERGETSACERVAAECASMHLGLDEDSGQVRTGRATLAALRAESEPAVAIEQLLSAGGAELELVDQSWLTWLELQLVRACIAAQRLDDAERWTTHLRGVADRLGLPASCARALQAQAELALARDAAGDAVGLAREATALAQSVGMGLDDVGSRLLEGRALAAAGERDEALAVLHRVVADAAALGATRLHDAAARELRRLGARVSAEARRVTDAAAGRGGTESLTAREREIADLVAQGHSNKQVAGALFLSEKTIEHHLSRVYAKVGVRSRTELAAVFARAAE